MRRYWELARTRIDDMSLRERAMIFAAAGFVVISLINSILLDPLVGKTENFIRASDTATGKDEGIAGGDTDAIAGQA